MVIPIHAICCLWWISQLKVKPTIQLNIENSFLVMMRPKAPTKTIQISTKSTQNRFETNIYGACLTNWAKYPFEYRTNLILSIFTRYWRCFASHCISKSKWIVFDWVNNELQLIMKWSFLTIYDLQLGWCCWRQRKAVSPVVL